MNSTSPISHPTDPGPGHAGREVHDERGERVGTVTDVLFDQHGRPDYLVVDPGLFRAARYVPAAGSYVTDAQTLVVPWGKSQIGSATKAARDHVLTPVDRRNLEVHYGFGPESN